MGVAFHFGILFRFGISAPRRARIPFWNTATETAQTFARVGIYADQRIGELLRELPTKQGMRTDTTSSSAVEEVTKAQALHEAGISTPTAYQLEALAANPEVVEQVIQQAEQDGRIPSRAQVLKAIRERDEAREEATRQAWSTADGPLACWTA